MTLRDKETFAKNTDIFSITTDEKKLRQLFDSLDFDHHGSINYSEFLAACLARKEGLRREYAELIFNLWKCVLVLRIESTVIMKDRLRSKTYTFSLGMRSQ